MDIDQLYRALDLPDVLDQWAALDSMLPPIFNDHTAGMAVGPMDAVCRAMADEIRKLRAVVDALPRCSGCANPATRHEPDARIEWDSAVVVEHWRCDEHMVIQGWTVDELPYAEELRELRVKAP